MNCRVIARTNERLFPKFKMVLITIKRKFMFFLENMILIVIGNYNTILVKSGPRLHQRWNPFFYLRTNQIVPILETMNEVHEHFKKKKIPQWLQGNLAIFVLINRRPLQVNNGEKERQHQDMLPMKTNNFKSLMNSIKLECNWEGARFNHSKTCFWKGEKSVWKLFHTWELLFLQRQ